MFNLHSKESFVSRYVSFFEQHFPYKKSSIDPHQPGIEPQTYNHTYFDDILGPSDTHTPHSNSPSRPHHIPTVSIPHDSSSNAFMPASPHISNNNAHDNSTNPQVPLPIRKSVRKAKPSTYSKITIVILSQIQSPFQKQLLPIHLPNVSILYHPSCHMTHCLLHTNISL